MNLEYLQLNHLSYWSSIDWCLLLHSLPFVLEMIHWFDCCLNHSIHCHNPTVYSFKTFLSFVRYRLEYWQTSQIRMHCMMTANLNFGLAVKHIRFACVCSLHSSWVQTTARLISFVFVWMHRCAHVYTVAPPIHYLDTLTIQYTAIQFGNIAHL